MINSKELDSIYGSAGDESSLTLNEIFAKYLYHWPIFILGVLLSLSMAFVYMRYTQPVFAVNSTLLVKDDKKGNMPAGNDILSELSLFGVSKVVDNEIEILKSKTLMRKVVDRLNLGVNIKSEGTVKSSDLYSNKPVEFRIIKIHPRWFGKKLLLTFPGKERYILEDEESGEKINGLLNQLQRNTIGVYKIDRSPSFVKTANLSLAVSFSDPISVADQYLKSLSVTLASKQSTVLNLSLESAVPERGQDVLNTLIQVYNEAALEDKNKTTASTIEFIDGRLKLITGELNEVEKDVESFKSSRGLTDISSDANLFLENVKNNDVKLAEVDLQLSVIQDVARYVNSPSMNQKIPSTLGISDPVLLNQITQLGHLQLQRDQLLATTTERNPILDPINQQIETTSASIKTSISNIAQALKVSKSRLEGNNSEIQGSIKMIPGQERQLISIKRQQTIKESLYLYLLQKKEEAALSYASSVADSRTVDSAYYSKVPVKPRGYIVYLAALMLGFFFPVGYLYGKELLNNKVTGYNDVTAITETPILGDIILTESNEPIVVFENSRNAISEQFRSIRTNLDYLHGKPIAGKGRVTLFTSAMSGEGKTFVASNVAAALAVTGKKTVLIELDLRKPKISKYLHLANDKGLSNYLIGKSEIKDILQPSQFNKNLVIIGSGPLPPNPSELLIQEEMDLLINFLRVNFDEIVIDTPPIGLVADAQILSRLVDVSIYIIRQNVTYKDQVKNLDKLFISKKFPKLNVILNGVDTSGGYGYGYGYYSDDFSKQKMGIRTILKRIKARF